MYHRPTHTHTQINLNGENNK